MYNYRAKVIRWVDGDTLLLEIDLGFYVKRTERIRLARINTSEIRSDIGFQRRKARHARAVGKKFCNEGETVTLKSQKIIQDMYARYIAEVTYQGINLSDYLLEKGVAKVI